MYVADCVRWYWSHLSLWSTIHNQPSATGREEVWLPFTQNSNLCVWSREGKTTDHCDCGVWHAYSAFFDNDYDQPKGTHALMIKDKTNDEVCYFISFRNVELLCLQDLIKVEAHERPIRVTGTNTEQRSKTGLHYMTATTIESNWIALLVWAHPEMGLCIKRSIIIARMVQVSVGV